MKPLLWLFLKFLPLWLLAMVIGFTIAWWQRGREARRQFTKLKERLTAEKGQTSIATQQALESSESHSRQADELEELKQEQPAAAAFAGEPVTQDKALGIIFSKRSRQIDDLTEIKGVGPVLSAKLNEFGVYRFQQIALWDDAVIEEFSKRLKAFRNRIQRDDWLQQAKALHDKRHGS